MQDITGLFKTVQDYKGSLINVDNTGQDNPRLYIILDYKEFPALYKTINDFTRLNRTI